MKSVSQRLSKRDLAIGEWFCHVCNKDLKREDKYKRHCEEMHIRCPEPGCSFSGPEFAMAAHRLTHAKAADGSVSADSEQENRAWVAARRRNFPSRRNMERKATAEEQREQLGALPDEGERRVSLLEKLLRQEHGLERGRKGSGKAWGKSWGDKGKGWGKDKGKGKKGKKGKGKKGSGKGKGWGWGSGKRNWDWEGDGDTLPNISDFGGLEATRHALVFAAEAVLPSVVANCVPLEAPFGTFSMPPPPEAAAEPRRRLKWPCRFFERGFCFHGDNCQYEHGDGSQLLALPAPGSEAAAPPFWLLPSTLANRAGRPGEGPRPEEIAGNTAGRAAGQRQRPTRVQSYHDPGDRERRDGLLRRLMRPEVNTYYSAVLQCVRYIVATDFLRLERVPPPISKRLAPAAQEAPTSGAAAAARASAKVPRVDAGNGVAASLEDDSVLREDLDDADIMELASVLV